MSNSLNNINDVQGALISALSRADAYPHNVDDIQLIETHISWVFLTGPYVYKIKKPVNFGFLDFSTLEKRQRFCEKELRLNRRLAEPLYLDVIPIHGPAHKASLGGTGETIEYAVKMLQFDVENTFDNLLLHGKLTAEHIAETAEVLARFHANINIADKSSPFGTADAIGQPAIENFEQLSSVLSNVKNQSSLNNRLHTLREWTEKNHQALTPTFNVRKQAGFIRECHGDLHLRNITLWENHVTPFDCIEFNDNLRWIDVISELAFLLMDLDDHQQAGFSRQLLNHYLSLTGDYDGLQVLRFYQVYRAMVRAKVAGLRLGQIESQIENPIEDKSEKPTEEKSENEALQLLEEINNYLRLAESYTKPQSPTLLITHGLSGSGKSYFSKKLSLTVDVIHLRSDVERKRCFGLTEKTQTQSEFKGGIYSPEATQQTYRQLLRLSRCILSAGISVLVDATFLQRQHRDPFKMLANDLNIPFTILHCEASDKTLRTRLRQRQGEGIDASEADEKILTQQQKKQHSLESDEWQYAQTIQSEDAIDATTFLSTLNSTENNPSN